MSITQQCNATLEQIFSVPIATFHVLSAEGTKYSQRNICEEIFQCEKCLKNMNKKHIIRRNENDYISYRECGGMKIDEKNVANFTFCVWVLNVLLFAVWNAKRIWPDGW